MRELEIMRTLSKRLQVRLDVLEDVLESTGIMNAEKREELYAKHSAAFDQLEAKELERIEEEMELEGEDEFFDDIDMGDYSEDFKPGGMSDKLKRALEELDGIQYYGGEGRRDVGEVDDYEGKIDRWMEDPENKIALNVSTWSACGCRNCHRNIRGAISYGHDMNALDWYDKVTDELCIKGKKDMLGNDTRPIGDDKYLEWLKKISKYSSNPSVMNNLISCVEELISYGEVDQVEEGSDSRDHWDSLLDELGEGNKAESNESIDDPGVPYAGLEAKAPEEPISCKLEDEFRDAMLNLVDTLQIELDQWYWDFNTITWSAEAREAIAEAIEAKKRLNNKRLDG